MIIKQNKQTIECILNIHLEYIECTMTFHLGTLKIHILYKIVQNFKEYTSSRLGLAILLNAFKSSQLVGLTLCHVVERNDFMVPFYQNND